jgi:hypothetical protein
MKAALAVLKAAFAWDAPLELAATKAAFACINAAVVFASTMFILFCKVVCNVVVDELACVNAALAVL